MDTADTATRPILSRADDAVEPLTDPRTPHVLVLRVSALRQNAHQARRGSYRHFPTRRRGGRAGFEFDGREARPARDNCRIRADFGASQAG